jgi:hypothetical protein
MRTVGRLLRLSLAPSAAADIAAGVVLGAGFWPPGIAPFLLIAASLCVYHGGMALNDWADRAHDEATRPERPIPSGSVPADAAALLGFTLLIAGPWIALGAARPPAFALGTVAVLAAVYDLFGRGPLRGPLLLAACRAGNLSAGLLFGRAALFRAEAELFPDGPPGLEAACLAVPLVYGAYVFLVSRLGRLEDGEDERPLGRRPAWLAAAAATLLLLVPVLPLPPLPALSAPFEVGEVGAMGAEAAGADGLSAFLQSQRITLAALVAAAGAFGLARAALQRAPWTRGRVMQVMGMALRRLLILTSAAALARGTPAGLAVALAILCGYPLSFALRKVFPPT